MNLMTAAEQIHRCMNVSYVHVTCTGGSVVFVKKLVGWQRFGGNLLHNSKPYGVPCKCKKTGTSYKRRGCKIPWLQVWCLRQHVLGTPYKVYEIDDACSRALCTRPCFYRQNLNTKGERKSTIICTLQKVDTEIANPDCLIHNTLFREVVFAVS